MWTPYGPGILNAACPINWAHPLNRGLVSEWTAMPQLGGRAGWNASTWFDLAGISHGALQAAPPWDGNHRTGGFGSLKLNGSSQYSLLNSLPKILLVSPYPFTVCAWLNNNTASSSAANQSVFKLGASGGDSPRLFVRYESAATGWLADTATTTLGIATAANFPFSAGEWFFFCFTDTGSLGQYYKNGSSISTGTNTGAVQAVGASDESSWGRYRAGSTRYWGGYMDQCMIYNRALSAVEVSVLYQESLRGNPERYNWLSTKRYFFDTIAVATTTAFRKTLSGVGSRVGSRQVHGWG